MALADYEKKHIDTQNSINEVLKTAGVKFDIRYVGETVRDEKWKCDAWRFTVVGGRWLASANHIFSSDYYTGLGHRKNNKPTTPHVADVLYSLVLDTDANDMSFDDWADTFGFNADSIKDLTIYKQCCENARHLKKIFSPTTLATIRELLQDY